ncbi:MAG: antibiotic biosynthesis monooxygenase [Chloroflexota bacterium]
MTFIRIFQGKAKVEKADAVAHALHLVSKNAETAEGVIQHKTFQSTDDPTQFTVLAMWETEDHFRSFYNGEGNQSYHDAFPEDAFDIPPSGTSLKTL